MSIKKNEIRLPKSKKEHKKTIFQFEVTEELSAFLSKSLKNMELTKRQIGMYGLKRWLAEAKPAGYEKFLDEE